MPRKGTISTTRQREYTLGEVMNKRTTQRMKFHKPMVDLKMIERDNVVYPHDVVDPHRSYRKSPHEKKCIGSLDQS